MSASKQEAAEIEAAEKCLADPGIAAKEKDIFAANADKAKERYRQWNQRALATEPLLVDCKKTVQSFCKGMKPSPYE